MSTEFFLLVFDKWRNENSWSPLCVWTVDMSNKGRGRRVIQETNQIIYISKSISEAYEAKQLRGHLQGEKLPLFNRFLL